MKRQLALLFSFVTLTLSPVWAEMRRYALVLDDDPVAKAVPSRAQLHAQAAVAARSRIAAAQKVLRRELSVRGLIVTGSVDTVLNAVFVEAANADRLQGLPGVRRVAELRKLRPLLDQAVTLTNVPAAWQTLAAAGKDGGAGVKIGILDTGIDNNHPGFQDNSLNPPSGFPKCSGGDCAYTNRKVIVARSYTSMLTSGSNPADDTSPRDRGGHGTAAAMIAAGVQHSAPLATISGVAPKAFLGNYRIFGSPMINDFSTGDVLIAALNDALNDGMDIVSLSVGLPPWFGPTDTGSACSADPGVACEVEAQAVENAVASGLTVVVSAGNDGDLGVKGIATLSTIYTPGTAPSAITVGASRNQHLLYGRAGLTASGAPVRSASVVFGGGAKHKVTAPMRDVTVVGNDGLACTSLGAGSLNGAIALIQRGTCDFRTKLEYAQAAGAVGVLFYREAGADTLIPPNGLGGTPIPAALLGYTNGVAIKNYLSTNPGAEGLLDPAPVATTDPNVNAIAAFSSRGPSIDNRIKPELVAPGTAIYTATQRYDTNSELYNASGYAAMDGTSFSAPLVAGAVALVKAKNPSFTPAQLKSAVVNTATTDVAENGAAARIVAVGAGKLDAGAAVRSNVTVSPATLSLGVITAASIGGTRVLSVTNGSAAAVTLSISGDSDPGLRLRLSDTTVAAGQTRQVTVYLEGSVPAAGSYEGAIAIRGGAADIRVPYLYLVGDGTPFDAFALQNDAFADVPGQRLTLALRVVDRYGVGVTGTPVVWTATQGNPYIDPTPSGGADTDTKKYGFAGAYMFVGSTAGPQTITAKVGSGTTTLSLPFAGAGRTRPVISANGVIDAASSQAGTATRGLAPGSYISIWGENLADAAQDFSPLLPTGLDPFLPIALSRVSVTFQTQAGDKIPGRLTYAGPSQINVQIPWELTGQSQVRVMVSYRGWMNSANYTLYLADAAPGLFEYPLYSGFAVARDPFNPLQPITTTNKAKKGQWLTFYANGLGPVDNTPKTGEMTPASPLARCRYTPDVTIGAKPAQVDFAGLTPTGIGYYQINVKVPDDAPSGNQPVTVRVNGVMAKTVNLPIE